MTPVRYDNNDLGNASPSALDSQNQDVQTAIDVLKAESNSRKPSMDAELLDAAAEYLSKEVL